MSRKSGIYVFLYQNLNTGILKDNKVTQEIYVFLYQNLNELTKNNITFVEKRFMYFYIRI